MRLIASPSPKAAWLTAAALAFLSASVPIAAQRGSEHRRLWCDSVVAASGWSSDATRRLLSTVQALQGAAASSRYAIRTGCGEIIAAKLRPGPEPAPDALFADSFEAASARVP